MTVKKTSITFSEDLEKRIDKARGLIPRSTYIAEVLREHLEAQHETR